MAHIYVETPKIKPKHIWVLLALTVVTIGLYANSLNGGFVLDDQNLILQNPLVLNPHGFFEGFKHRLFFYPRELDYYRPLVVLSFALDYGLWNGQAIGFHLTNLILHLGFVICLYFVFLYLCNQRLAIIASFFFAVFACHTENVAFISGRMDILASLFMILCLLVYLKGEDRGIWPVSLILCFLLELCALLSKELSIIFPFLFGLCILHRFQKKEWRGHFVRGALFIGMACITYLVLRFIVTGMPKSQVAAVYPFNVRLLLLPGIMLSYLQLIVFPFNLNALHIILPPEGLQGVLLPMFLLILLTSGIALLARRSKPVAFGSLWFMAAILPVMNLLPLEGTLMADRFLYLPSAGFALLLADISIWAWNFKKRTSRVILTILILIGVNNVVFTLLRNPVWHNGLSFFSSLAKQNPMSCTAHHNLGSVYFREGDLTKAEQEYRQAIALNPKIAQSHAMLGDVLYHNGNYAEAIQEYLTYLELFPECSNRDEIVGRIQRIELLIGENGKRRAP